MASHHHGKSDAADCFPTASCARVTSAALLSAHMTSVEPEFENSAEAAWWWETRKQTNRVRRVCHLDAAAGADGGQSLQTDSNTGVVAAWVDDCVLAAPHRRCGTPTVSIERLCTSRMR